MTEKSVIVCDICNKNFATCKCDICGIDLCNHCKKEEGVWINREKDKTNIDISIIFCSKCAGNMYSLETKNKIKQDIIESLKKGIVLNKLK